jgi:hypothetical protein
MGCVVRFLGNSFLFPYEFLLPHMKKGDPRDWVGTTVPCYRSALELETSPRAASLLTLCLLPWYLGKYHDPRAELSDHGTCHGTTVLPAPRAGT